MTTAQQLEAEGTLVRIEIELDPDEVPQRLIYALPRVIVWLDKVLPAIETDGYIPGANHPSEQADSMFYDFISGKTVFDMPPHNMEPANTGVWELRTHDLRFFGFFWRKGVFIATSADTKAQCAKITGLYSGHRDNCSYFQNCLDLDPPKFVPGSKPEDVL